MDAKAVIVPIGNECFFFFGELNAVALAGTDIARFACKGLLAPGTGFCIVHVFNDLQLHIESCLHHEGDAVEPADVEKLFVGEVLAIHEQLAPFAQPVFSISAEQ